MDARKKNSLFQVLRALEFLYNIGVDDANFSRVWALTNLSRVTVHKRLIELSRLTSLDERYPAQRLLTVHKGDENGLRTHQNYYCLQKTRFGRHPITNYGCITNQFDDFLLEYNKWCHEQTVKALKESPLVNHG